MSLSILMPCGFMNLVTERQKDYGRRRLTFLNVFLAASVLLISAIPEVTNDCFLNPIGICAVQKREPKSTFDIACYVLTMMVVLWIVLSRFFKLGLEPQKVVANEDEKSEIIGEEHSSDDEECRVRRIRRRGLIVCSVFGPVCILWRGVLTVWLNSTHFKQKSEANQIRFLTNRSSNLFLMEALILDSTVPVIMRRYIGFPSGLAKPKLTKGVDNINWNWNNFRWYDITGSGISGNLMQRALYAFSTCFAVALLLIYSPVPDGAHHILVDLSVGYLGVVREALRLLCWLHSVVVLAPLFMGYLGVLGNVPPPTSLVVRQLCEKFSA